MKNLHRSNTANENHTDEMHQQIRKYITMSRFYAATQYRSGPEAASDTISSDVHSSPNPSVQPGLRVQDIDDET